MKFGLAAATRSSFIDQDLGETNDHASQSDDGGKRERGGLAGRQTSDRRTQPPKVHQKGPAGWTADKIGLHKI